MSTEFHRPTYEFHNNAYNATEVRLYGIPSIGGSSSVNLGGKEYDVEINLVRRDGREHESSSKARRSVKLSEENDSNVSSSASRSAESIPAIELKIRSMLVLDSRDFSPQLIFLSSGVIGLKGSAFPDDLPDLSSGVIFGYAFEGHCYDLPKPKLMLIPTVPRPSIPADDCGYDVKENYAVWVVDKLDKCVEFEVSQGFIEQLVLEANLPGRRSPSTYRATQSLAHRNGRLTD